MAQRSGGRITLAVTLSLLMLCSMVAPVGASLGGVSDAPADLANEGATTDPGVSAPSDSGGTTAGGDGATSESSDLDRSGATDRATGPLVDPALENASGPTEVIVRFEAADETPGASANSVSALQDHAGQSQVAFQRYARGTDVVEMKRSFWITNAMLLEINASEVSPGRIAQFDEVTRVHANFEVEALEDGRERRTPTPAAVNRSIALSHGDGAPYNATYGLHAVNATETWEAFGTRGSGVNVTVLDTGVNASHPDIDLDAWATFDSAGRVTNDSITNASDADGHGTHVSGTVVGGNESGKYIGVAPNASLRHGQAIPGGFGTFAQIAGAMEWAVQDADSDVISMSLGFRNPDARFIEPVQNVRSQGIPLVVAAGNEGEWRTRSPANVYGSISVGAVDANLDIAPFSGGEPINTSSTWGSEAPGHWPDEYTALDIAAPGVGVLSANATDDGYRRISGTSMATPHVSGVVALMLAENGSLSHDEVETTLEETAHDPHSYAEPNHRYGAGIVDALNATASVTVNTTVTGQVTDADGTGLGDAIVETEYGLRTTTNATGWYELAVPSTEQNLTADAFGYEPVQRTIDVTGTGSFEQNFTTGTAATDARLVDEQSLFANVTSGIDVSYRVRNVGNYSIDFDGGQEANRSDVTLLVDGESSTFEENVTVDADEPATIDVEIDPDDGFYGTVGLDHTFYDRNGSGAVTDVTSPVRVHDDPVRIPEDVDPESLQDAITFVDRNTTLELGNSTYEEPVYTYVGGPWTALHLHHQVSLTSAEHAEPTIEFTRAASNTDNYGVFVQSPGSTVSGLTLDGQGTDTTSVIRIEGDHTEIHDVEITRGMNGVRLASGTTDAITNSTFHDLDRAVYSGSLGSGDLESFANNTALNIRSAAIDVASSQSADTAITDNDLTIDRGGSAAVAQTGDATEISGNQITLNGSNVNGIVTEGAPESAGTVTVADNRITGGNTGIVSYAPGVDALRNNTVRDTSNGIYLQFHDRQSVLVEDNTVENVTNWGIQGWGSSNVGYRNNTIDGTGQNGILVRDSLPVSEQNVTVANNSISSVSRDQRLYPAIYVTAMDGVDVVDNDVSEAGILFNNTHNVIARQNAISNSTTGFEVTGNSSDLSLRNSTFTGVEAVFAPYLSSTDIPTNVTLADANVTTSDGAILFDDVPADRVEVANLSLADGTRISASGHNASLSLGQDPSTGNFPANHSDVGSFLDMSDAGAGSQIDLNVSYGDGALSGLQENTLELYRYSESDSKWETVQTTGVNTTSKDVWASVSSFSTFAPLAEKTGSNFTVRSIESNASTVLEGETVQVNATIENTGGVEGERNVTLEVDDGAETLDFENVTIGPGNESVETLEWQTESGDAGDYNVTVDTGDDTNTTAVSVDAPAYFSVNVTNTSTPVVEGESVGVNATINNTGDVEGTRNVTLEVDPDLGIQDNRSVTIGPGNETGVELTWSTQSDQAGDYNVTVNATDSSGTDSVRVNAPANFTVEDVSASNSSVVRGEVVTIDATINNTGDVDATQQVNLSIGGTVEATKNVTVEGGETNATSFDWNTSDTSAGEYAVNVSTDDGTDSADVSVQAPANFSVNVTETDLTVAEGETLQVNATINNTGDVEGTQNVTLSLNESVDQADNTSVSLGGGNSTSVALEWTPGGQDAGNYTATVASDDTNDTAAVEVENASIYFGVELVDPPASAMEGESFGVTANVTNHGANATQNVTYAFEGSDVETRNVTLNDSESTELTFTHTNDTPADYTHSISTANESNSTSIAIEEEDSSGGGGGGGGYAPAPPGSSSPAFAVTSVDLGSTEATVGETVSVDVSVDNDGDAEGEYTATLTADGETVDTETVSINANWHETVTLSTNFDEPGTYQLAVGGETAGTVEVSERDGSAVTVSRPTIEASDVQPGDAVTISMTAANQQDTAATQTVDLVIGGETVDSQSITLEGGEVRTVTFQHTFETAGSYDVNAGDESLSESVDVANGQSTEDSSDSESADGDGGGSGNVPLLAMIALLGVLVAGGSLVAYCYGDEIAAQFEE